MAISDARKEQMMKYAKEKLKRIPLDVRKEDYVKISAHAAQMGESVNGFIKRAIDETMKRDNGI